MKAPSVESVFGRASVLLGFLLCTGTALATEYVVNGDFDDPADTAFTTSYTFIPSAQSTTPGTFGIRSESTNFNPGYTDFFDFSGTGNMMLVDGSPDGSGAIVWSETVTVPLNTEFEFSAEAASADPPQPSTLRFSINGVELGSDFFLSAPAGQYQEFSQPWDSGSSTTATITIVDTNTVAFEADGNDFALDNISLATPVPEPGSFLSAGVGTLLVGLVARRRWRRPTPA